MPIVALPPDNTERWWVVYTTNGDTHRMMMRTADGALPATVSNAFHGIFNRMTTDLFSLQPLNLEFSVRGSNVRNIAPWTNLSTYGSGTAISTDARDKTLSFVGRTSTGRKSRLFLFGWNGSANGDYRVQNAESANVASVVAYLSAATGAFLAIDGAQAVWKGYANSGLSDHWLRKHRG